MKIAILRQRVSGFGGAETTLRHLVRGLAAAGHDVVLCSTDDPLEVSGISGPGVRQARVPVWGKKTARLLSFAINARRLLQELDVQLVFSLERTFFQHVYRCGDGCHREWLARRSPHISGPARLAQQLSPFHQTMLRLEGRLFAEPDLKLVIANSRQVREEVVRHYGFDTNRIRLIYNGLDRERFKPLSESERRNTARRLGGPEGGKIILFVGSGFARKGLAYLIEALGSLKDDTVRLWVVGKGRSGPYLKLAARLGVADQITFWGPKEEVAPFYQAAGVLALPTLYDPCSNAVLEALASGLPVVTTSANGASEFIRPEQNGAVLSRPDDIQGLAAALKFFLEQDGDRKVRQAASEAVAHLSWETTTSRTVAALEEAALLVQT
ncbi:MAG: glycosyltransferase family 4 protein [Deltaproteobacteria bacterium]|nr:glycosyltransferase family 4 protein [Deltaproteobacteria bacterium]